MCWRATCVRGGPQIRWRSQLADRRPHRTLGAALDALARALRVRRDRSQVASAPTADAPGTPRTEPPAWDQYRELPSEFELYELGPQHFTARRRPTRPGRSARH